MRLRFCSAFKKFAALITAASVALTFCSCGDSAPVAGEEYILAAREEYVSLDSARVDVINDATGTSEQVFIYKYDEKGLMTYSYYGVSDGEIIAQYNNGYEQYTEQNGIVSYLTVSDISFTAYSKDVPYPMADKGLILFYKGAVNSDLSYIAYNDLAIEVCHVYDISKLSGVDTIDGMTGFKVLYYFDGEGNFLFLQEVTEVTDEQGNITEYSYSIYISRKNEIEAVPSFVDTSAVSGDII